MCIVVKNVKIVVLNNVDNKNELVSLVVKLVDKVV